MSTNSRLPVLTLASTAFVEAARNALLFLKIYFVPIFVYTLALVVVRVAWFEHVSQRQPLPVWAEVVLWAPFGALISIALFQYYERGVRPQWRGGAIIPRGFSIAVAALVVANAAYRYAPYWELELAKVVWEIQFGPDWSRVALDDPRLATLSRFAIQICGFAVVALIGMLAMGVVWVIATRNRFVANDVRHLVGMFPVSLFAFFFLFEVINYQIGVLYNLFIGWLGIPLAGGPNSLFWRERVLPELLDQVPFLPSGYILNLVWLHAAAVAYLWVDGRYAKTTSQVD